MDYRDRIPKRWKRTFPALLLVMTVLLSSVALPAAGQFSEIIGYDTTPDGWEVRLDGKEAAHNLGPYEAGEDMRIEITGEWKRNNDHSNSGPNFRIGPKSGANVKSPYIQVFLMDNDPASNGDPTERVTIYYTTESGRERLNYDLGSLSTYEQNPEISIVIAYIGGGEWDVRVEDHNGNLYQEGTQFTINSNLTPDQVSGVEYSGEFNFGGDPSEGVSVSLDTGGSEVDIVASGQYEDYSFSVDSISGQESPTPTPKPIPGDERLELQTQTLLEPNGTYPFTLYYWKDLGGQRGDRMDVTTDTNTTYDIENVSINGTQALSLNASGDAFDTIQNENVAVTVNVTATYSGTETLNTTKTIVVATATVDNLQILPGGLYRTQAVVLDNTILALLVAGLLSVGASRFVNTFAGVATAEMVIVVGWLGGYVGLGITMLSVFVAIFVGLNVAENIGIQGGGFRR